MMCKTTFTRAAIALVFAIGLARPAAAQIGEEVRPRTGADDSATYDDQLEHHRREMERHRVEMERHAREMREALMRAHGDSARSFYRFSDPGDRFIYSARVRQPCARMGIAFSGDDTVRVEEVREGSGADEAGVRPGDVIVSVDGERASGRRMSELAAGLEVGDEVRLVVRRDGRERTIDVTAREDVCPLRTMLSHEPFTRLCMTRDSAQDDAADEECEHEFVYALSESMAELRDKMPLRVFTEQGDSGTWIRFYGADGPHDSIFIDLDSVRMMSEAIALQFDSLRRVIPFTFEMADSLRVLMPSIEMDMRDATEEMHAHGLMLRSLELGARALAGANLTELNDDLAEYFDAEEGVLVTRVEDDTPASRAGLRGGDVIVQVNGTDVHDLDDVRRAAARAEGPLDLTVMRRGDRRTVRISE